MLKYLSPFGHIQISNLVGVGQCNNPCFELQQAPPPAWLPLPICDINWEFRTGFAVHYFVVFNDMVYDACVGPFLGQLSVLGYFDTMVDTSTTLPYPPQGNASNALEQPIDFFLE